MNLTAAPREAMQGLVEELLEETDVDRPPVDGKRLAQQLGLDVCIHRDQQSRGKLVNVRRQTTIVVRPEPRDERHQWTIAHEIGEHLMGRLAERMGQPLESFDSAEREELSNQFARLLLVPDHWFRFDVGMTQCDLIALKSLYPTASYEVLAIRLLDLDPPTIVTIFDNGKLTRRIANFAGQAPPLLPIESASRRAAHDAAAPQHGIHDGIRVQAWPIHEAGWKREILRTIADFE